MVYEIAVTQNIINNIIVVVRRLSRYDIPIQNATLTLSFDKWTIKWKSNNLIFFFLFKKQKIKFNKTYLENVKYFDFTHFHCDSNRAF